MGHILNNTIQDVLTRHARMTGFNACWVPGTDHASIATEAKVVRWLREDMGLTKGEVGRDKFIEYAWQWTEKYGGIILTQLRKLGCSCDWERTAFTMDDTRYPMVIDTFIDLYQKGKLYRGKRMVNWDPEAKTVLSNEEVIYGQEQSKLHTGSVVQLSGACRAGVNEYDLAAQRCGAGRSRRRTGPRNPRRERGIVVRQVNGLSRLSVKSVAVASS